MEFITIAQQWGAPGLIILALGAVIYRMAAFIVRMLEKRDGDIQKSNEALFTSAAALRDMISQKNVLLDDKRTSDIAMLSMSDAIKEMRQDLKIALGRKP